MADHEGQDQSSPPGLNCNYDQHIRIMLYNTKTVDIEQAVARGYHSNIIAGHSFGGHNGYVADIF